MRQEIIVEIGNSHEGSLGIAKSFVDMVQSTGADTVKFQMHIAEFEGLPSEEFRVKFSDQDSTRQDYWNRVSFSMDNWTLISSYANSKGLEFLCTPFSIEAAKRLMEKTSIKKWKVGSGDASNFPLIDYLISTNMPLIISTGLVSKSEIEKLIARLDSQGAKERTTLMHCVSQYPTPIESSALHLIDDLRSSGFKVGLSDHSGRVETALFGLSIGIELLEIHLTPHKLFFGPDTTSSLCVDEISALVNYRNSLRQIKSGRDISREDLYNKSTSYRSIFRKGIYWNKNLEKGHVVTLEDLTFLKPSLKIDAIDFEKVIGRKLSRKTRNYEAVEWGDLDE